MHLVNSPDSQVKNGPWTVNEGPKLCTTLRGGVGCTGLSRRGRQFSSGSALDFGSSWPSPSLLQPSLSSLLVLW
jgi:hypothetical protein